ncbi:MAG: hypothetical protein V4548_07625 [Bacteroidota bacterium]
MKARINIKNITGIIQFDISANITGNGAGGITFKDSISDFESVVTANLFDNHETKIDQEFDSKSIYLTLKSKEGEFEIHIDLLNGKITSMTCKKGYSGKLLDGLGIGSKMSDLIKTDATFRFDLDHEFYVREPFDGIIIYPPNGLASKIFDAVMNEKAIPDFQIEIVEIVEMKFAEKLFNGTLFF